MAPENGGETPATDVSASDPNQLHRVKTAKESGFSCFKKSMVGLSWATQMGTVAAVLLYMPIVYVTEYKANPIAIGFLESLFSWVDGAIGPLFGIWSDKALFNVACFRDVHAWGRRSPRETKFSLTELF